MPDSPAGPPAGPPAGTPTGPPTVLIADDSQDLTELLEFVFTINGYKVLIANNGKEAIELAKGEHPDVAILDVNMPLYDGFEVCRVIKSSPETENIAVLMVTAQGQSTYRVKGLNLGAEDYIVKPFNTEELVARVRARVRTKEQSDQLYQLAQKTKKTFERYVSPGIVKELLANPERVRLGGNRQQVTVLLADLRGFTSYAEKTDPVVLIEVLNKYLSIGATAILEEGGTIDKFIGDAVMGLFNAPLLQGDHVLRAARAGLAIRERSATLNTDIPLQFGVTIHTGMAVVGNIGAAEIMDYTAIGDTVNLASRLQEHAKGGQVIITDVVLNEIDAHVKTIPLGPVKIRGRVEEVDVCELLGLVDHDLGFENPFQQQTGE